MYCPLIKSECVEKKCGWYVIGLNECAINTLAQALDCQADAIEEIKEKTHNNQL